MFIRRHYYDLTTGETIWSYMLNGNIKKSTVTEELETVAELEGRTLENTGVMEWLEPNTEIEAKMNGDYIVSVDISSVPHALVFTERPKPEPIPEEEKEASIEDYEVALKELGV